MNHFRIIFRKNIWGKYRIFNIIVFIPGENGVYLVGEPCNYKKDDILFDSKRQIDTKYRKIIDSVQYVDNNNSVKATNKDIKTCIELIEKHNDNIINNKKYTPAQKKMYSVIETLYKL